MSLAGSYIAVAVTVVFMRYVLKVSTVQALTTLTTYICQGSTPAGSSTQQGGKKGQKRAGKQQLLDAATAGQLSCTRLAQKSIMSMAFATELNTLGTLLASTVLHTVGSLAGAAMLGMHGSVTNILMYLLILSYTAWLLLKVDQAGSSSRKRSWLDTLVWSSAMALSSVIAIWALLSAPQHLVSAGGPRHLKYPLLHFDLQAAAGGLDSMAAQLLARVNTAYKTDLAAWSSQPQQVAILLTMAAALLSVALLGPGIQYARLLHAAMDVPAWGRSLMTRSRMVVWAMRLGFLLPVAVVLSQVGPVAAYVGLPASWQLPVCAALLLAMALVHMALVLPLCQTFLDGGITQWYTLLHNGSEQQSKMSLVQMRLQVLRSQLVRTCMQLLCPAAICLCLGLCLAQTGGLSQQVAEWTQIPRAAAFARLPVGVSAGIEAWANHSATAAAVPAQLAVSQQTRPAPPEAGVCETSSGAAEARNPAEQPTQHEQLLIGLTEDDSDLVAPAPSAYSSGAGTGKRAAAPAPVTPSRMSTPSDLLATTCMFLGWWVCAVWSVVTAATLTVLRLGLNVGI